MKTISILIGSLVMSSLPALAQNNGDLPAEQRINGKLIWAAFEPQRQVIQKISAVIYKDSKSRDAIIYGTIVTPDGHILTKASEIKDAEKLSLRVGGELFREVKVIDTDPTWDVALLKIEPTSPLTPVALSDGDDVAQGTWLISNGSTMRRERRIKVGIASAITREIDPYSSGVVLGVGLGEDKKLGLKILEVTPKGGADKAGVKKGDIIKKADGKAISKHKELLKLLSSKKSGDKLPLEILRKGKTLKLEVILSARPETERRMTRNDQMSGGKYSLSKRRDGFPRVLHHDTPMVYEIMGGPVINLNGECVGMNIARASRVATFAIPARELREIIAKMIK